MYQSSKSISNISINFSASSGSTSIIVLSFSGCAPILPMELKTKDKIIAYIEFRDSLPNGGWHNDINCDLNYEVLEITKVNTKFATLENGDKVYIWADLVIGWGNKNKYKRFDIYTDENIQKIEKDKQDYQTRYLNKDIESTMLALEGSLSYRTNTKVLKLALEKLLKKVENTKTDIYSKESENNV